MSYPNEELVLKMRIEDLELDCESICAFENSESPDYYTGQNAYFCQIPEIYFHIFREIERLKEIAEGSVSK